MQLTDNEMVKALKNVADDLVIDIYSSGQAPATELTYEEVSRISEEELSALIKDHDNVDIYVACDRDSTHPAAYIRNGDFWVVCEEDHEWAMAGEQ